MFQLCAFTVWVVEFDLFTCSEFKRACNLHRHEGRRWLLYVCRWCLSLSFTTWLLSLHPSTGAATCRLISWSRNARRWICRKSTFSNIKSLFLPPFEALRVKADPKQTNLLTRYFISFFQWGSTGGLVSSVYQRLTMQNYNLFKW